MSLEWKDDIWEVKMSLKQNDTYMEYLQDLHAEQYTGTDDDMPDDFDNWLEQRETETEEYLRRYYSGL